MSWFSDLTWRPSEDAAPLKKPYDDDDENDDEQQVDKVPAHRDDERPHQPQDQENDQDCFERVTRHVGSAKGRFRPELEGVILPYRRRALGPLSEPGKCRTWSKSDGEFHGPVDEEPGFFSVSFVVSILLNG